MDLGDTFSFHCDTLPSQCYARFKEMKQEGKLCDVALKFGNQAIFAHRLVLSAAIPYFNDMFTNGDCESDLSEIMMKEMDPHVLEPLIDFAYSCEIEITGGNVHSLLHASCTLDIKQVKDTCCDFIGKRMNCGNVLSTRKLADELSCSSLIEKADEFIGENFDEVMNTDEIVTMPYDFMIELLARDDLRTSTEANVFQVVMKWIKSSPDDRKDMLPELLRNVRLTLLTPEYLMDYVHTEEYIKASMPCRDLLDEVKFFQLLPHRRPKIASMETKPRLRPKSKEKSGASFDGIYTLRKCLEVQHFDAENEKWEVMASTPLYDSCTLVGIPEKIYLIDADYIRFCNSPDFDWKLSRVFDGRVGTGAAVVDRNIYICGGRDKVALNKVERIDFLLNALHQETPMSIPRNLLGVVALGGYVYALGGQNGDMVHESVERFDPKTKQWEMISSMKSKRCGMSCNVMNNKIYVCGGNADVKTVTPLSSAEVYDPLTDQWKYISSMHSVRYKPSLVTYNGKMYALGGCDKGFVHKYSSEVYDPEHDKWVFGPSLDSSHKHAKAISFTSVSE